MLSPSLGDYDLGLPVRRPLDPFSTRTPTLGQSAPALLQGQTAGKPTAPFQQDNREILEHREVLIASASSTRTGFSSEQRGCAPWEDASPERIAGTIARGQREPSPLLPRPTPQQLPSSRGYPAEIEESRLALRTEHLIQDMAAELRREFAQGLEELRSEMLARHSGFGSTVTQVFSSKDLMATRAGLEEAKASVDAVLAELQTDCIMASKDREAKPAAKEEKHQPRMPSLELGQKAPKDKDTTLRQTLQGLPLDQITDAAGSLKEALLAVADSAGSGAECMREEDLMLTLAPLYEELARLAGPVAPATKQTPREASEYSNSGLEVMCEVQQDLLQVVRSLQGELGNIHELMQDHRTTSNRALERSEEAMAVSQEVHKGLFQLMHQVGLSYDSRSEGGVGGPWKLQDRPSLEQQQALAARPKN